MAFILNICESEKEDSVYMTKYLIINDAHDFKQYIYMFKTVFLFFFFLAMPQGMWDLSSPTRD